MTSIDVQPISSGRANKGPFEKMICKAAGEYTFRYYRSVVSDPDKERIKIYLSWLNRILYFQRAMPNAVFLPQEMFEHIVEQLGLSLFPINPSNYLELVSLSRNPPMRILKDDIPFIRRFYMCYSSGINNGTKKALCSSTGSIIGAFNDGALVLHSW